jgi:5-methylthioadenosine/S-adenosylhomocysteine deaminase
VRNQNRLVYRRDEDFIASLPSELRGPMQPWSDRFQLTIDDDIALFEGLYGRYRDARRVKVQLAPANLHWCSDEALTRLADCAPLGDGVPEGIRSPAQRLARRWSAPTALVCSARR